jgi:alkylation response protein AidB-like acyl-CoA dehydrogenase
VDAALAHAELVGALLYSADMVGGAFRVIDYTADYLRTRKQFGKVIGSFQALKHPLVDAFVGYERARSHLYAAAHSFADQGRGEVAVRMAKAQAEKAYSFAADRAIQFHGGFGFTYDCDAGLHRRRALYDATRFGDARAQKRRLAQLLF